MTPQPIPFPPSQASVGNGPRRPVSQKEDCCSLAQGRLPPLAQGILARGQEVARTALPPLQAGTLPSSPHQPRQASTTSQTDLERNTLVLLIPHTLPSPTESGLGPHSGSQRASRYLLLSQSHSVNVHLPQRGQPPALRGSGSRGTDHCIISHLPSVESNETTMGATVLCEGQGQSLRV